MATPDKNEVIQQLTVAWESAKAQLAELREAVDRNQKLADTKVDLDWAKGEKDRALRDLGEAIWEQVKRANFELPREANRARKAVEEAEQKLAAQASEITALLKEGDEAATRLRGKAGTTTKTVAQANKKR